jgi:hypothetical protein
MEGHQRCSGGLATLSPFQGLHTGTNGRCESPIAAFPSQTVVARGEVAHEFHKDSSHERCHSVYLCFIYLFLSGFTKPPPVIVPGVGPLGVWIVTRVPGVAGFELGGV